LGSRTGCRQENNPDEAFRFHELNHAMLPDWPARVVTLLQNRFLW
jgi:hypothetical protein